MAPEIIRKELYTFSVDWWSYGVLVYEMLTGKCFLSFVLPNQIGMSPFSGDDENSLYNSIQYDRVIYLSMSGVQKDFCAQVKRYSIILTLIR